MSADKYVGIFSRQREAIGYVWPHSPRVNANSLIALSRNKKIFQKLFSI